MDNRIFSSNGRLRRFRHVVILISGCLLLAACSVTHSAELPAATAVPTPTETRMKADLPDLGLAPEFKNDTWLNTDAPIRLAALRGKVVLLEFWTFACINCQRTTPWIKQWHEQYAGDDFAVVTIHYPEFSFERDIDNVANALQENGITYPVAIDNERLTWDAYGQRYWPTTYLIDKNGRIRYVHIGEFTRGSDKEAVAAIEALLAEGIP